MFAFEGLSPDQVEPLADLANHTVLLEERAVPPLRFVGDDAQALCALAEKLAPALHPDRRFDVVRDVLAALPPTAIGERLAQWGEFGEFAPAVAVACRPPALTFRDGVPSRGEEVQACRPA